MRNVGFCGIDEITNSLGVIEDLERLSVDDRVPRDNNNNGELQHSFSTAVDEVFAWQIIIYWWTQKNQKNLIDRQNFIILCIRVHKMFKSRPDGFKTHHHYRFLLPKNFSKPRLPLLFKLKLLLTTSLFFVGVPKTRITWPENIDHRKIKLNHVIDGLTFTTKSKEHYAIITVNTISAIYYS